MALWTVKSPGDGTARVPQRWRNEHRDAQPPGGGRGVEEPEHLAGLRMAGDVQADRLAAAGAGQGEAQVVVAEAGHGQGAAVEPVVPRQRQRADAAAEGATGVGDPVRRVRQPRSSADAAHQTSADAAGIPGTCAGSSRDTATDGGTGQGDQRWVRHRPAAMGNELFFDATNPRAREFIWDKAKRNYYDKGIRTFWLDEAEPDLMGHYDWDLIRYHAGPALKVGNIYPLRYAQAFYEGQTAAGQDQVLNLIRCAWAGSQRYGALLWSGDVHSTFESLRRQFAAGLNAGLSGISWWTTDIGGFTSGDAADPAFRELLIRWFQYGVFCPVTRLHGFRNPFDFDITDAWRMFDEPFGSGADNEVWSYGDGSTRCFATSCGCANGCVRTSANRWPPHTNAAPP